MGIAELAVAGAIGFLTLDFLGRWSFVGVVAVAGFINSDFGFWPAAVAAAVTALVIANYRVRSGKGLKGQFRFKGNKQQGSVKGRPVQHSPVPAQQAQKR